MWNKERTKEALACYDGMQHQSRTDCSCVHLCEDVQKQKNSFFESKKAKKMKAIFCLKTTDRAKEIFLFFMRPKW